MKFKYLIQNYTNMLKTRSDLAIMLIPINPFPHSHPTK